MSRAEEVGGKGDEEVRIIGKIGQDCGGEDGRKEEEETKSRGNGEEWSGGE